MVSWTSRSKASYLVPALLAWAASPLCSQDPGEAAQEFRGHSVLAADASKGRIGVVDEKGALIWEYPIRAIHDLHVLENGHYLFQTTWTEIVEVSPAKEVVWRYDAKTSPGNADRPVEVHAFQRLADGVTMIVESGPARILEVSREGEVLRTVPMKLDNPHHHYDSRLARKLDNGHYLVCHEGHHQLVREYGPEGEVVWEHAPGSRIFSALRLENGNTLIGTGDGHSVIEVSPEGETVWSLDSEDLPGITLAWVTTVEVMPNGNLIVGNCHAGPDQPQLLEVTRDKKVVWTFRDFKNFGNSLSNATILGPVRPALR